jgi:predicted RNA-binding protein (virulence factor B family)
VATNLIPYIHMHEFALLEVTDVSNVGAFLDWGLEKNLMVPFSEQRQTMEIGRWYVVYMGLDEETDRLYASNKIERHLDNEHLTVKEGDEVQILIYRETELGFSVIVNNKHKALVFKNEVFRKMRIGETMLGYIKTIHDDNKLDVSLTPIGYENFNSKNAENIFRMLQDNKGFLPFTDKSAPGALYAQFGISKKAFKKAIGELYKDRKIKIESKGIRIV